MKTFGELFQTADWKAEKHVPVIDCPEQVKAEQAFGVTLTVGKEIAHPNTTEHHIRWITLFFQGQDDKFPYEVGRVEFTAHGEASAGANQGPAYSHPQATIWLKLAKSGVLYAASYCNIHGFWQGSREIMVTG
jgi:superoxide reductase